MKHLYLLVLCSCLSLASFAQIGAIYSTAQVCVGSAITNTDATSGGTWSSSNTAIGTINSSTGSLSGIAAGTLTITYTVGASYVTLPVTVNPLPTAYMVTGGGAYCAGGTGVVVGLSGTQTGVNYQLINGATPMGAPVAGTGAALNFGLQTVAGTYTVIATNATTTCSRNMNGSATVTISSMMPAITGPSAMCTGSNITLSDSSSGGTWSSASPAMATVGVVSGIVTGVAPGVINIIYTLPGGCSATHTVTVNPLPTAFSVSGGSCGGSSISITIAGSQTGVNYQAYLGSTPVGAPVAGSGGGFVLIFTTLGVYTVYATNPATGCSCTMPGYATLATSSTMPAITGPSAVCTGNIITLSDSASGAITWSSSNTAIATIGSGSGVVTGVSAGVANITITLLGTCHAIHPVTVNPLSAPITGPSAVCPGNSITLYNSTSGGSWSTSNTLIATIGSATGIVTGVAAGVVNITYLMASTCYVTYSVTVNTSPAAITGPSVVCLGNFIPLSDASGGGTWLSSNPALLTVGGGTGVVTGVSVGVANISYTLSSGCFVTKSVTITTTSAPITGSSVICQGGTDTLTDASGPGTWTTSNPAVARAGSTSSWYGSSVPEVGMSPGTATISYTLGGGCTTVTFPVTVTAAVAAITGSGAICPGQTITLADATPGGAWSSSSPAIGSVSTSGVVTGIATGTTTITYAMPSGCFTTTTVTVSAGLGTISGPTSVCVGATITLSDASTGGTWSSSDITVGTVSAGGIVTGTGAGTATISYSAGSGCTTSTYLITVNPAPSAIAGPSSVCPAQTVTLTDATAGGTWSSSNTAIATVASGSGVVTGISAGTATITYTLSGGCYTTTTISVLSGPAAITGQTSVCLATTITLSDATAGGAWSSSDATIASVGTSGVVLGVSAGTATISYALGTGCPAATYSVTVVPPPPGITGPSSVCYSQTITLTSGSGSGTWSSSNPSIASVGSATGVVTGSGTGMATITYTISGSCFVTRAITVSPLPSPISGVSTVCVGTSITLTDITSGGSWSSVNPAIASITTGGVVSGLTTGSTTISYTMVAGCAVGFPITVNASATSAISGPTTVCLEQFITLSDATTGGTWHSGNTGIATINSGGVVTPVSAGNVIISYTISGCPAVTTVTVTASSGVITGTVFTICAGSTLTLADTTSGGTWSSGSTSVATVNTSGTVTGVSAGTANITYLVGTGCPAIKTVTVTPGPITGTPVVPWALANPNTICSGAYITVQLSSYFTACDITYQWQQSSDGVTFTDAPGRTWWYFGYIAYSTQYWRCKVTATNTGLFAYSNTILVNVISAILSHNVINPPTSVCGAPDFNIVACASSPSLSVVTRFGDGTSATSSLSYLSAGTVQADVYHTYSSAGTYTVKQVLYSSGVPIDSVTFSYQYSLCYILPITYYYDANNNCVFDAGDHSNLVPVLTEIDSNGVHIGNISCTSGFYYKATGPVGTVYKFKFLSSSGGGMTVTCPTGGVIYDTIQPSVVTYPTKSFALICSSGTSYDLAEYVYPLITTPTYQWGYLMVYNNLCPPEDGDLTLNFSPQYNFSWSWPAPTSVSGHTATWHVTDIAAYAFPAYIYYMLFSPSGVVLPPGDTVHSSYLTTGTLPGDTNPANNFIARVDTVKGSYDPNQMSVSPSGSILPCTPLQYTIGFENTGNDTAFNVTVMDTLSQNLDPQSLKVEAASAAMNISLIPYGNQTIVRFDFPSINLLDSSHHGQSEGMVVFDIKTKPGLADGTTIDNYAGIIFDVNPAVITNVVESKIGIDPIVGATAACVDASGNIAEATEGGVWSLSNANASLTAGVVTGITAGTDTISYTVTNTCGSRTVSSVFTVNPLPSAGTITGASNVCAGSAITLIDTLPGGIWGSSNGNATVAAGVVTGVYAGTATIQYSVTNGCGTATAPLVITINPLPTAYNVLPPGSNGYCIGGPGIDVQLSSSDAGISYRLFNGVVPVTTLPGTGGLLDFSMQSTVGAYTIVATNLSTTCTASMSGAATISINPLPLPYIVYGGGGYCAGSPSSAPHIFQGGSQAGVNYNLYNGTALMATIPGTGGSLDFGSQPAVGCYTVVARNATTGCTSNMPGSACIATTPLPTVFNVSPAGSSGYCTGGAGIAIRLSSSNTGFNYQLFNSAVPVSTLPGTGSLLDFGLQTAAGAYTIVATDVITSCTAAMTGTASISTNPLPAQYNLSVAGGGTTGSYCAGGAGVDLTLSNSDAGVNYQLYMGTSPVGTPVAGTGLLLDLGHVTAAGTYTAVATNAATLCTNNMLGSATISINPLPGPISGPSAVCAGATITETGTGGGTWSTGSPGVATVGSATGIVSCITAGTATITYTLPAGCITSRTITVNPLPAAITGNGTICLGSTNTFADASSGGTWSSNNIAVATVGTGTGMVTGASLGTSVIIYTLTTGCLTTTSVTVYPLPLAITGTTNVCAGLTDTLRDSTAGGVWSSNSPIAWVGMATGMVTGVNAGIAVIKYTLPTGCYASSSFTVKPLPAIHTVSGGGYYCSGGAGLHIGLFSSDTGIAYQLYHGGSVVGYPLAGTGAALDFGVQFPTGLYVVWGKNNATTCTDMMGSETIDTFALPHAYNVTGGGAYCAGSTGLNVGLSSSDSNIRYQLWKGSSALGSPLTGTGSALDFGFFTAGTYKVVARDPVTTCTGNMNDSAAIFINTTFAPVVTISITKPTGKIMAGDSVTLHATVTDGVSPYVYQWINYPYYIAGATTATYTATNFNDMDSVICEVSDNTVCGNTLTQGGIRLRVHTVSVQPVNLPGSNLTLIPNPNKGIFTIRGTLAAGSSEDVSLEVKNMLGQVIYNQTVHPVNGELNEQILLNNNLANGTYLLNVRSGTENQVFHFVIEK